LQELYAGLGEPKIYHQSVCFTRMWWICLECVWLWRISGAP